MIGETRFTLAQAVADGDEVLTIGDIHGEAGLLGALLAHAETLPPQGRRVLAFTGDLIDRGPHAAQALGEAAVLVPMCDWARRAATSNGEQAGPTLKDRLTRDFA